MPEEPRRMDRCAYVFSTTGAATGSLSLEEIHRLRSHNPSQLLEHYRVTGQKEQAVSLLFSMRRPGKTIGVIKEIIHTYIYFGDYEGALDYIKHYERTNEALRPTECLLRVQLLFRHENRDEDIFQLVQDGLLSAYAESLVRALVCYYKKSFGEHFLKPLRPKLELLDLLFTEAYTGTLTYAEARYLYRIMPSKAKFLRQMVKQNPHIRRKYYAAYVRTFGIQREDIIRILSVRCVCWAFKIALRRRWIDRAMRAPLEGRLCGNPLFINRSGDWGGRSSRRAILFLRSDAVNRQSEASASETSSDS